MTKKRILNLNEILTYRETLRKVKKTIVFTNGCFDIIHFGHIKYLFEAAKLGDTLLVAVNSDSSVRKLKGEKRPIFPQEERTEILASLECVDFVTIFEEETPFNIIKSIVPDVLVKGGDYKIDDIVGKDVVEKNGGKVVTIPYIEGYSTTEILKKTGNL